MMGNPRPGGPGTAHPLTGYGQLHALRSDERWGDVLQLERGEAVQLLIYAFEHMIVEVPRLGRE